MGAQLFRAEIMRTDRGGGGHLVEVPPDVIEALGGGGRIPVNATFGGIPYRGSVVRMGGITCIGVRKDIVEALRADHGSVIEVTLERDTAERTVEVPHRKGDVIEATDHDAEIALRIANARMKVATAPSTAAPTPR